MINVLFVGSYSKYNIELLNQMVISNRNFRLCGIINSVDGLNEIIRSVQLDAVIINIKEEIYNKLFRKQIVNIKKYNNITVFLLDYGDKMNNNIYKYECIVKAKTIKDIANIINPKILNEMRIEEIIKCKETKYIKERINEE